MSTENYDLFMTIKLVFSELSFIILIDFLTHFSQLESDNYRKHLNLINL